jgi:1,4-dihydroxy-2-naphthoate polyprenyltransferase
VVPIGLGAVLAAGSAGQVRWALLPLVVACSLLFHAGTNLVSDAADYVRGLDREGKLGGSGVLVEKIFTPKQIFRAGVAAFVIGALLATVLVWVCGPVVLYLGLAGLAGGFFYGGTRFAYKYHGLGDVAVFVLMGPSMVIGAYFVLTGTFSATVALASLPVACLVAAILSGNNYRDIESDLAANVRTVANVLGPTGARIEYCGLIWAAYGAVPICVVLGQMTPWSLMALATAPLAARSTARVIRSRPGAVELASIDVDTAKLHFAFGLLLCAGVLVASLR